MKKPIVIIGILTVAAALFFILRNASFAPAAEPTQENVEKAKLEKVAIDPNMPGITLPLSSDPKDLAWALFQKYLSYNKSKNIEVVKSAVYKIAPVCEDPQTRIDCEGRMGAAYAYGSQLKKEDFIHVWSDERQTILATDFELREDESIMGRHRAIIYFVKNEAGELKMLSFSPAKGMTANKGAAPREEILERLVIYTEDQDEDGISDYEEECLNMQEGQTCIKTSPKLRDTDGDGLWDGIEFLMQN